MKTGICPVCHLAFKITKTGKIYRHGYKQEIKIKRWKTFFGAGMQRYYKLTQKPCRGSGQETEKCQFPI